jgi:hypothetical protein
MTAAVAALGFGCLMANNANAAVVTYLFDTNGATTGFGTISGTYDWDATTNGGLWNPVSTGLGATNGWVQNNFPKFAPTGTPTYTVTVSNDEKVTGMFASTAQNLTINAIGSGTLEAIAGADGFLGSSSASVTINAPISGAGQLVPSNGGNLYFYGTNTYTGGTSLTSTSTLIHFNKSASFGTGPISMDVAGFVPLLASGGTTVTIPNNFTSTKVGGGINFAADANTPVVSTGNWNLGADNLVLRNNGVASSPLTLSGVISGTATVSLSANASGIIVFSGINTYTGATTVGVGSTAVTLTLGAANTIASSSSLIMAGGILNPDAINQLMSSTTLGLTVASKIDFTAGASELDFANSSALTWATTLNLTNWTFGVDKLRFGTDSTGLTSAQLADIEFNGAGLGTASLDANGYVVVPEPASLSLLALASTTLLARKRRA